MKAAPSCRSLAPPAALTMPLQAKAIKSLLRADSQDSIRFILLSRQNIPPLPSPLKTQKNRFMIKNRLRQSGVTLNDLVCLLKRI